MMEKKYCVYFDILTILACLMVVFFHCNMNFYNFSDTMNWKLSVVERCVVYSAIPIFFMLTGAKLMEYRKRYSTREYVKKRLLNVGIPFVFWNVFYIAYRIAFNKAAPFSSFKEAFSMFINSDFQSRYWFFWPLFAIYAAIPVLSLLLEVKQHRKYLWYVVSLAFVLRWVICPIFGLMSIQYNSYITMPLAGGFVSYSIFGYLVSTEDWSRVKRAFLYIAAALSGLFAIFYTIKASQATGETQQMMVSYHYFPSGLMGAALFVFIKHAKLTRLSQSEKAVKIIRTVSECCMGIWLIHSLVITIALKLTGIDQYGYLWRFAGALAVFVICLLVVWVAKKIPLIKHIV